MLKTSKWSVKDFLSQYDSFDTIACYRIALRQFFSLVYPELKTNKDKQLLNELSLRYFEEERDIRKDIIRFKNSLIHMAPKTRISKFSPIFRFFEDNDIVFSKSFIRNINGKGREAITVEHVPTSEEINRILQYLPIQAKTLTLVLTSSGMRLGEAVKLTIHDLDLNHNPARIYIPAKITKTKRKRLTFISSEAKNQIEEWLAFRDKYIKQANRKALGIRKSLVDADDLRIFPFTRENFIAIWKLALKKSGLLKKDRTTKRITLRPHNLRKFFRTHGQWTNPDIAEALMGHQAGMSAIYARYDQAEEILERGYQEAEPNLSIFEHTSTMIKLKERVEKQSEDIQELVTNLSVKNIRLENEVNELSESQAVLHRWLDAFNNTISILIETIEEKELQEEMIASLSEVPKLSYLDVVWEQNKEKK